MRVIAGSAKGRKLGPVPSGVRPLSDRAREGMFSSLGSRVVGARVLDLFAGTGAVGIEALSRGAGSVTFVDSEPAATAAVRDNLTRTGLKAKVVTSRVGRFLSRAKGEPFELVFVDPPYSVAATELDAVLSALADGHLGGDWTVCVTRPKRDHTHVIPIHWAVARRLSYGDSLVILYREEPWA